MGNIAASLNGDSAKTFLEECRVYDLVSLRANAERNPAFLVPRDHTRIAVFFTTSTAHYACGRG